MKRIITTAIILVQVLTLFGQTENGIVKLRGTRLTYPLVSRWIAEFKKEYPAIKVSIAPTAPADSIDFSIASYELKAEDLKEHQQSVVVSRYVQLPIVNNHRQDLAELQAKGIKNQDLSNLFFSTDVPNLFAASPSTPAIALYVRDRPVCAVKAFASHYGADPKTLNGTGVKGDDQDLATAVKNDVNGISFNNLGFIYDTKTRKVNEGLAIIPLDLNENGKVDKDEQIYSQLDDVIAYVESTRSKAFVNEVVNFVYRKESPNKSAAIFLNWVLTKGQAYNNALGFINLEKEELAAQQKVALAALPVSQASCENTDALMKTRKTKTAKQP